MNKLKSDIDAIYTPVPIDMPFEPQVPKSHARRLHDAKVLENAQRLKNIEDMDKAKTKFRKYRRMNEEEQKATGFPTDSESIRDGVSPIELELGFDPFLTYDDIEVVTPPSGTVN